MYDAFISYSRADLDAVEKLKQMLDERRLHVFLDLESLRAGQDWPSQLGAAVQNSRRLVVCWSAKAAASDWVKAEIKQGLITKKPVLPWLLDGTHLPASLRQVHGSNDAAVVARIIADERGMHQRRRAAVLAASALTLVPALWYSPRVLTQRSTDFRGHVVDGQGNALADVLIEAEGLHTTTKSEGDFAIVLPGPPSRRALRLRVSKPGYVTKTIDTQADVPDLGVVFEKER